MKLGWIGYGAILKASLMLGNLIFPGRGPAIGNRVYTNDVRLRGRRGYSGMENHRVKSLTRAPSG